MLNEQSTQNQPLKTPSEKNIGKEDRRKSITVDNEIYLALKKMKDSMSDTLAGKTTFNMVVQSLFHDHDDLLNVKQELESLKKETEETQNYIRDMLKLALSAKSQTQFIGSPQFMPMNLTTESLIPPPPKQLAPPKKTSNYIAPDTGNLKKDYINEITQLFTGEVIKPSDLIKITKPKHIDSEIKPIAEEAVIPDIFEKSTAKNFPKADPEEESNV
jgi:hypothetical protein